MTRFPHHPEWFRHLMDFTFELYLDGREPNMVSFPDKYMVSAWSHGSKVFHERCQTYGISWSDMPRAAGWCYVKHMAEMKKQGKMQTFNSLKTVAYLVPHYIEAKQIHSDFGICDECNCWPCGCEEE